MIFEVFGPNMVRSRALWLVRFLGWTLSSGQRLLLRLLGFCIKTLSTLDLELVRSLQGFCSLCFSQADGFPSVGPQNGRLLHSPLGTSQLTVAGFSDDDAVLPCKSNLRSGFGSRAGNGSRSRLSSWSSWLGGWLGGWLSRLSSGGCIGAWGGGRS